MQKEIYSEATGQLLFKLFDGHIEKKVGDFYIHHHTTTELGHITFGDAVYKIDKKYYDAKKDKTLFICSDQLHCVPTVTEPLSFINLHITPYYFWSICADYVESSILQSIMKKTKISHEYFGLEKYFDVLKDLLYKEETPEATTKIRRTVLMIIIKVCEQIEKEGKSELANSESESKTNILNFENIQNAINYIDSNFDEEISIDKLISVAKLSRSVFSAEFKNYTGMSAVEYLIIRRLEKAMYFLRNTDMKISDIAEECGFTNLSNFNRLFKKVTKITPKEYRKR